MCFLLGKVSMAAECHRIPQRALVKKLTRKRRDTAREWALLQGLERTLEAAFIAAARRGDLLTGFMMEEPIRRRRSLARVCTPFTGLATTLRAVLLAAARRGDLLLAPMMFASGGVDIDPIRAITYWKGDRERTWRPIARRTNACRNRAEVWRKTARERPAHIKRAP